MEKTGEIVRRRWKEMDFEEITPVNEEEEESLGGEKER